MRRVRYARRARNHLISIARYLFDQTGDIRAGEKFVREVEERMAKVGTTPTLLGRPRADLGTELRSITYKSYLIFIRYHEDRVDVLHVMHSQRDLRSYFSGAADD